MEFMSGALNDSVRPWVDGGRRVSALRNELGLTQQDLADRLGISRAALSHIESGQTVPGERTVALLAGVFKLEPHELIAGTSYPIGKAERLPVVVTRYTEVEHQLLLLDAERELAGGRIARARADEWAVRLRILRKGAHDRRERDAVDRALTEL